MRIVLLILLAVVGCSQDTPQPDNRYLSLRLPYAQGAEADDGSRDQVVINLARDGRIMVDGRWLPRDELPAWLAAQITAERHEGEQTALGRPISARDVVLRCDERTPWLDACWLQSMLLENRFARLHFATRPTRDSTLPLQGPRLRIAQHLPSVTRWLHLDYESYDYPVLLVRIAVTRHAGRWAYRLGDLGAASLDELSASVRVHMKATRRQWEGGPLALVWAPADAPTGAVVALIGTLKSLGAQRVDVQPVFAPIHTCHGDETYVRVVPEAKLRALPAFDIVYCPGPLHPHHFWDADIEEGPAEPDLDEPGLDEPEEIEEVQIDDDFAPKLPDD